MIQTPDLIYTTATKRPATGPLEKVFNANLSPGNSVPTIEFPKAVLSIQRSGMLCSSNPTGRKAKAAETRFVLEPNVPSQEDDCAAVVAIAALALLDGYPRIDWVASKRGITRRALQRRLDEPETTFKQLLDDLLPDHSSAFLAGRS